MDETLVLIHTMPFLVDVFTRLCQEKLPGVRLFHVLDEPLLEHVRQMGGIQEEDFQQLQTHITFAESIAAKAVLVTCSTLSPGVDHIRSSIPVIKIDEAMIAQAVSLGSRIGVVATNRTTLTPAQMLLEHEAQRTGRQVNISLVLVENALPALLQGDGETHDALVKNVLHDLEDKVDVIVLAQASMARVLSVLAKDEIKAPVLASPFTAIERVKQVLLTHP